MRRPLIEHATVVSVAGSSVYAKTRKVPPGELWIVREICGSNPGSNNVTLASGYFDVFGVFQQGDTGASVAGSNGQTFSRYLILREGEQAALLLYAVTGGNVITMTVSGEVLDSRGEIVEIVQPAPATPSGA